MTIKVTGGDKLKAVIKNIADINASAKIGWFSNATYSNGDYIASVAIANEYGAVTKSGAIIPPRPFMKMAYDKNNKKWANTITLKLKQNNYKNVNNALEFGAIQAVSDIQSSILYGNWIANSAFTIKKKGFNKPLIDTGLMLKTVSYSIKSR